MATYFGRPAFEWTDTSGAHFFQFPAAGYTIETSEEWHGKVNISLDRSTREVDSYGEEYVTTLTGTFISESDMGSKFRPFLDHVMLRRTFTFYPHWPHANRPVHLPAFYLNCMVLPDFKFVIRRSEGAAGRWDFALEFVSASPQ